jgi:hypothetical protein
MSGVMDIGILLLIHDMVRVAHEPHTGRMEKGESQTTNGGPKRTAICARMCCRLPVKSPEAMQSGSTLNRHQVDRRVLASSIDFKVEFELVTFVQFTQARTLNRADVHECVRLAVITRDEAEALHRVEELDRASSLFTGQLALGCCGLCRHCDHVAHNLKVGGRNLATAIHEVEFELLTFCQTFKTCTFNRADVHEHIFAAVFALDEAEALLAVEELYNALAGSDNLGWHAAATAAATWAAEAATTAAARATEAAATAAAKAATVTAAEAAAITTTEAAAITAAKAAATTAAAVATAATKAAAAETAAVATVGVKTTFVAETVALVASATPPPSVKTHKLQ